MGDAPADAKPVYWHQAADRGPRVRALPADDRPAHRVPPTDLLPDRRTARPTPYIYSEAEIPALMAAAGRLATRLGAATLQTMIGLLAVDRHADRRGGPP